MDRRNFHLFQPLTYQVATGALSPGEIAYPLRAIFKRDRNIRVLMAEVTDVDLDARELRLGPADGVPAPASLPYDTLIVAGGSRYSFFGHDEWAAFAEEVKSLESALLARSRILAAFEAAEMSRTRSGVRPGSRSRWSAAARPELRWPARSPSSRATRSGATSDPWTLALGASCWSRRPIGCSRASHRRFRRRPRDRSSGSV